MPDSKLIDQFNSAYKWIEAQTAVDQFVMTVDNLCAKFPLLLKCAGDVETRAALIECLSDAIVKTGASFRTKSLDSIDTMTDSLEKMVAVYLKHADSLTSPPDFFTRLAAAALECYDLKEAQTRVEAGATIQRRADVLTNLAEKLESLPDPAAPGVATARAIVPSKPISFKSG